MNIKKIIIREALVLLGFILLAIARMFIGGNIMHGQGYYQRFGEIIFNNGFYVLIFGYPVYLFIRTALWLSKKGTRK